MQETGTTALLQAIMSSAAYKLAESDTDFLALDELRAVRLMLEFLKPDMTMREHRINSTLVVFGSARILPEKQARALLEQAESELQAARPGTDTGCLEQAVNAAKRKLHYAHYYEQARTFSELVSCQFQHSEQRDFVVVTGGGPGIMMAANQGAFDVDCESIGLNITLPHEQQPNPYITPELAFRFHYFALRKMHFLLRARALVAFPGGYGTLDELVEALTLVQTGKMEAIPIILFGRSFWEKVLDIPFLVAEGMIDAADAELVTYVETAQEAVEVLKNHYGDTFGHCPVMIPRPAL